MTPALNKPLPELEANATGGVKFTPQAFLGKTVVLYFYPKDNTPGCTTEAMQFRDHHKDFTSVGAVVFGVSRDNMASHAPLNRLGDDEDLKGLTLLFASDAGKHITGQWLAVDGGVSVVTGG